jgi:hypothetical protein
MSLGFRRVRRRWLAVKETNEGIRVVHPPERLLETIRVGDTISVAEGGRALGGADRDKQDQLSEACLTDHGYRRTRHHNLPCMKFE